MMHEAEKALQRCWFAASLIASFLRHLTSLQVPVHRLSPVNLWKSSLFLCHRGFHRRTWFTSLEGIMTKPTETAFTNHVGYRALVGSHSDLRLGWSHSIKCPESFGGTWCQRRQTSHSGWFSDARFRSQPYRRLFKESVTYYYSSNVCTLSKQYI